jgi:hypothetical protein
MSDREKLPELIDRYNNGKLSGEELTAFLEMVRTNSRLREEVRLDSELNEILANGDILELRQKIMEIQKKHLRSKGPDIHLFLLAASFLLLLGIEVILFMSIVYHNPSKSTIMDPKNQPTLKRGQEITRVEHPVITSDTVNKGKSTVRKMPVKRLAANFRKNPSFENMIGATRYAGYFRMKDPVIGYRFSRKAVIRFEWILEEQTGIDLKIMDNTGKSVHESGSLGKNNYSLPPKTLDRGLYYFKVLQNDEILYFGKFSIE